LCRILAKKFPKTTAAGGAWGKCRHTDISVGDEQSVNDVSIFFSKRPGYNKA
jgi:hypothetical protein